MNQNIIIDSRTNIPYGSFYIKGLSDIYGKRNVKFSGKPFLELAALSWNIRFIVINRDKEIKVFIHTNDSYEIEPSHYDWCDIYGHVNANFEHYPIDKYPKLKSLVPSFAIRNFNFMETIYFSIKNLLTSIDDIKLIKVYNIQKKIFEQNYYKNIRRHFLNYLKNYLNRVSIETYENKSKVNDNKIFFLSTLWYSDEFNKNDEGVNRRRSNFIEVCKDIKDCDFEGGLLADSSSSKELFISSITNERLTLSYWIQKTKESVLVFNTPAFWDCHGWKLGEYLALGKAIITTPLSNDLPEPLIHGQHVHIIQDSSKETIHKAITYILENSAYRMNLEMNARKYWEEYGTPRKSIELLGIDKLFENLK